MSRKHGDSIKVITSCDDHQDDRFVSFQVFGAFGRIGDQIQVSSEDFARGILPADVLREIQLRFTPTGNAESTIKPSLYCRIFREATEEETFEPEALEALGDAMSSRSNGFIPGIALNIPAAYTYFGQFLTHDMTKLRINDSGTINMRSAGLDLDTLFGELPPDLPNPVNDPLTVGGISIGRAIDGGYDDLPRAETGEAAIPDRRNDNNIAVAQLHVLFCKFYQTVYRTVRSEVEAKHIVRSYYQWLILNDFMPRLVDAVTYRDIVENGCILLNNKSFLVPIEFAAAFFRIGHSMIRPQYRWSSFSNARLSQILDLADKPLDAKWVINWRDFLDVDRPDNVTQNYASSLDTFLAGTLSKLSSSLIDDRIYAPHGQSFRLSEQTLLRGHYLELPPAQPLFYDLWDRLKAGGGALPEPATPLRRSNLAASSYLPLKEFLATETGKPFLEKTPLYLYALAEAEVRGSRQQLGPFGGRVVGETLMRAVMTAENNIVSENWQPDFPGLEGWFDFNRLFSFVHANW